ncbi:PREDICTED: uncharacterized protein LOC104698699 [Camelina sativa]|uniref:Uncharacterized protein LOC104698699 n=1 Tax=Camelina sativa TaxID=90675 RepID=A0ABM0SKE2_CAMSA|nr:PREDICTED: uncharacterized protein LOC104698699 [Camelina sativa]
MEFPEHFVTLLREFVTTPSFSVSVNRESCGYFKGAKGLRQGDSISPYLFTLAMEVFSQMLNSQHNTACIGHHPSAVTPQVSHLAFADDIMVFFDGSYNSLENIIKVLRDFCEISSLHTNMGKTDLFIAGVNQPETERIAYICFKLGSLPIRYLGLPLMHRKLRIAEYKPLIDKISANFTNWSTRALSYAGRKNSYPL